MGNQHVSALTGIPELDGYFFDADGEIYSTRRVALKRLKQIVTQGRGRKLYYRVKVAGKLRMVHRLVASGAFGSQIPHELQVNHMDGDTGNNRPSNLEVVTHKENCLHAQFNSLYCSGEQWYAARR